jgi:hypothetical protein
MTGGRLHRGELRRHGLELPELDEGERRDQRHHHRQHENHPLSHLLPRFHNLAR